MMLNRLIAFSLRRRALVLVSAAVLCALGLYSALSLPVDVLPNLNRPTVSVIAEAPGLQPEDVERQVTLPIEAALSGAAGSATVRSVSGNGFALVHIEFGWACDVYRNRQIVQERLEQTAGALPPGVKATMLADASIMGEILLIGLAPESEQPGDENLMELRAFADSTLRPRLMALPGVANVSVIGGRRRQCQVLADPRAMRDRGVTFSELKDALQQATNRGSGGTLIEADREIAVESTSPDSSPEALAAAIIKTTDNVPVRVGDVATVRIAPQAPRGDAAIDGRPALILAVQKQAAADTRAVTAAVDSALQSLRSSLPRGVRIESQLFRQSDFISAGIGNVSESLAFGAVLAALILLLFLFRIRPALVTLVAVPVSLLGTAVVFKLFGQSINCMTLGGIAIGVGELADDAIVDVENVQRRLAESSVRTGRSALETVFAASVEVRSAIVYGTAMVLLALAPLFFLPGLDGRLFAPLAGAYIASIFVSMFVALTVTPALASLLLNARAESPSPLLRASKAVARTFYDATLPRPWAVLALLLVGVLAMLLIAGRLGREYLPPFNETTLTVQLRAWPSISLSESNALAAKVEALLLSVPEVRTTGRRTGRAELDEHAEGLHSSEIEVVFWDARGTAASSSGERQRPAVLRPRETVLREIQDKLRDLPALSAAIGQPIGHRIDHLLSGSRAPVVIKIRGDDLETLRRISTRAESAVRTIAGVAQIQTERPSRVPRVRARPNADALANSGFTAAGLADYIQTLLNGQIVARGSASRRTPDVLLWSPDDARQSVESLRELPLVAPSGADVRLGDVAELTDAEGPAEIRRENGARQVTVSCAVEGRDLGSAVAEMQRAVAQAVQLPPGYALEFSGEFEGRTAATRTLFPAALCALALAALLLYGHFRSGTAVLLVLLNIPFACVGGIAALALAHEPLSLASLVGFITLAGISGRNGVLLLTHYVHLVRNEGLPFNRETIVRGSQERVAPVLMTALTTGLALIPLLIRRGQPGQELLYPMALVVVGGLLSTTLLDFAVTPALVLKFFRIDAAPPLSAPELNASSAHPPERTKS